MLSLDDLAATINVNITVSPCRSMRVEGKAVKQRTSHHLVRCGIIDIIRYYALLNMKGRGITRMCQVTKRTKYNICTCDPPVPSQPANLKSTVKQTAYKDKSKKSLPRS